MHPYWIQKIEESRRSAVTTFWIVTFLVVVLPIILVMKVNAFVILAIVCFVAAGLRMFSQGKSEMMVRAEAAQARMHGGGHAKQESAATGPVVGSESGSQWQSTQATVFPGPQHPHGVGSNGVPTRPEFATSQPHNGVRTDAFGHNPLMNSQPPGAPAFAAPVQDAYLASATAQGQPLVSGVIQDFSAPQEPIPVNPNPYAQTVTEPITEQPKRPMHFHDIARR